jgi:exodeoxyribonuclease-3
MRIVSWNVNGLRAAMQKGFEGWMAQEDADVICLQETKLQADQIPASLNPPPGGESHWSHAEKKGYSGVAMLVKGARPRSVEIGFGHRRYDEEGRVLVADYGRFLLVNGYFPSGSSGMERVDFKLEFYRDLTDWLAERRQEGRGVIIVGDLNTARHELDLARPDTNRTTSGFMPVERDALERIFDLGFVDTFRMFQPEGGHYSWWSQRAGSRERNVGWRIDYVLVSEDLRGAVRGATIHPNVMGSDHCPVSVDLAL